MTKIYAIRNKQTKEFVSFNSKCAWSKAGNAKNAWAAANKVYGKVFVPFDEQDTHEIVELTEVVFMYEGLYK